MTDHKNRWVNGLDSLRFILALVVMLSHLHDPVRDVTRHSGSVILRFVGILSGHVFPGVVAVSAFFLISGFVIHFTSKDQPRFDMASFLVRRWVRVGLPLALLLLLSHYFGRFILAMVWSLYAELIYYTLYPLLRRLRFSWKVKMVMGTSLSLLAVCLLLGAGAGWIRIGGLGFRSITWQMLIAMVNLPIWMAGILMAERYDSRRTVAPVRVWLVRGALYVVAMVIVFIRMRYSISTIYTCLAITPLLYLWLDAEIAYYHTHKASKMLEWCGRFSYSLYLWHLLALQLLSCTMKLTVYTYPVYIVLSVVFAYVAYLLIERPAHMLARRLAKVVSA